jgi:hypothetical protein
MIPDDRNPTKCAMAKSIRAAAKRRLGLKLVQQKDPLPLRVLLDGVSILVGDLGTQLPIVWLSWAAMVMVMWTGFLRYKDMANVFVECVRFYDTHMEIFLAERKNDQFRKGDIVYISRGRCWGTCPVRLVQLLISRAGLRGRVPLFQGWCGRRARRGYVGLPLSGKGVSYDQCKRAFFCIVAKATGRPVDELMTVFGTQSCRSGGATVAARLVDFRRFMQHGAWHSAASAHRYIDDSVEDRVEVTRLLGY